MSIEITQKEADKLAGTQIQDSAGGQWMVKDGMAYYIVAERPIKHKPAPPEEPIASDNTV